MTVDAHPPTRVMVVGCGWYMTSGISHYTGRLSTELAARHFGWGHEVSVLLMRRLMPRRAYPGPVRIGAPATNAAYPRQLPVYDGVDWYWGSSMRGALEFMDRQRPEVVILQWWTGAVLHSYLRLAGYAARHGARIIMEWHAGPDAGGAGLPGGRAYVAGLLPWLLARSSAHVVHCDHDLYALAAAYPLGVVPVRVIKHGSQDHLARPGVTLPSPRGGRYADPDSWEAVTREFAALIDEVLATAGTRATGYR